MTAQPQAIATRTSPPDTSMLWLLGQPSLEEYLAFVATRVVGGSDLSVLALADEWRAANDHFYELEQRDRGDADRIGSSALPIALEPLADAVRSSPLYRATFDIVPTTIEMVEIDRLLMWQLQVSDDYAAHGGGALGRDPNPVALFNYCLPLDRETPPFTVQRLSADRFQLVSEATDFGAQSPQLLGPAERGALATTGPVAAAVAIPISFGANFMSAIRSDDRILLHNGYHRAYALRALGVQHAPCIIQTVTRRDELKMVADARVTSDPAFYFRAARPPMLRDFFNRQLVKRLRVHPIESVVEIQITRSYYSATRLPLDPV